MKKKYKYITIIFIGIIISILSMKYTFAFLTDYEKTPNIYTIGKISIALDETDTDELGVPIENSNRVHNNEYHLLPGYTYKKDPTITIKEGSEDSYIRILVTINKIEELKKIFGNDFQLESFVNEIDDEVWKHVNTIDNNDDSNTYEFRYYELVNAHDNEKKLASLFNSFSIPVSLTGEQLERISNLKITIIGQAIQATGFENEDEAWYAFQKQFNK